MKSLALILLSLFVLQGCNTPGSSVKITSGAITTNALYSMNNEDIDGKVVDLGEHVLTDEPLTLTIRVYNKTQYPYTDLNLVMSADADNNPSITFVPSIEGSIAFPGQGGTCGRTLPAGKACEIKLTFAPREGRRFLETLTLNFKNYIDPEQHVAQIKMIAGMPASLAFTNDITQYTFGDLVGSARLPVVERAEAPTFIEELEVINAGGLPAKSLVISQVETCSSTLTNTCPTGMSGAYTIQNQCPAVLQPEEKCKVIVHYAPKNQDPSSGFLPELKEISYRDTVNFSYTKDPSNSSGGLNGYFRSVSTNIEARFKVAVPTISFETPVISGNRDVRSFRINNVGYREGEIKALAFRDSGGSLMATCSANATSEYLDCYDSLNAIMPLSSLPFNIKDKNGCLTLPPEANHYVDVGAGCVFDLYFQPSTTFITDKLTDFLDLQPEAIYDSRWQGHVHMETVKLFNLSAKSKAAARLVLDKVRYDSVDYAFTGTGPWNVDMGRLTLQSPRFFKRKSMIITVKNVGSVPATDLSIKDGLGRIISIGGAGVNLGAKAPYFYTSAIGSDSTCALVGPGESCSITLLFAPIGMTANSDEDANMFDGIGFDLKKFKSFIISYQSGALYTDTNRDTVIDITPSQSETRLQAQLIRKGMLMQLAEDTRNVTNFGTNVNVAGDTIISHIYLQNIGTGSIPYFRLMNPPASIAPSNNPNVTIVPTPDPASLGAEYDCLAIGDEDFTYNVAQSATPDLRLGNFTGLPKDEACVYTLSMRSSDKLRHFNSSSCNGTVPAATNLEEATRFFSHDTNANMLEYCSGSVDKIAYTGISFQYYDGDASDPQLPANSTYGKRLTLSNYDFQANQHWTGKMIPTSLTPTLTATLYRPGFTYPALPAAGLTAKVVPETWFYGPGATYFSIFADPLQLSALVLGDHSRNVVPAMSSFSSAYDYIYYLGSFPQGSPSFTQQVSIRNAGNISVKINNFNYTADTSFSTISVPTSFPSTVAGAALITPFSFKFNTTDPGEHKFELEYEYESGRHIDSLVYESSTVAKNVGTAEKEKLKQKILILAHVQATGTYGQITLDVEDYDVSENPGTTPTEVIASPVTTALTWNENTASSTLVFDTVKLSATATANDVYAKKRFTYKNLTSNPVYNLQTIYRADEKASAAKNIPATFKTIASGTTCVSGMTLPAFSSCTIIVRYQPTASDVSEAFTMSLVYSMAPDKYVAQNVNISLQPKSPGLLVAAGKTAESINYKVTPTSTAVTRSSYPLSFGTVNLDVIPKPINFDATTGTFARIQFNNTQGSKASLLKAYQMYSGGSSTSVPGSYRTVNGESFATIGQTAYVTAEASKGCFFGDDETNSAIPAHQKGFNNTTSKKCYVNLLFNANFNFLKRTLSNTNGDDMRDTALELNYYSVNRSSVASVWVHIKGTVNPDISVASGTYGSINAYDNKTVTFSTQKMAANNVALGSIVGLRVLMSTLSTGFGDPYSTGITTYVDIRPYDALATQYANFLSTSGLSLGQYFYFRVVAIRKDTRFTDVAPKKFVGLNANEYLSAAGNNTTPLKILVPPAGHYYFHNDKLLVEKTLYSGVAYDPYITSSNKCALRTKLTVKDPANVILPYSLIKKAAWSLLLATPAATTYSNMTQVAHWVGDPTVGVDAKCSTLPGFTANTASQMLTSSSVFYVRNSSNQSALVNQAIGGIPGTPYSNFSSYVDGAIGFASTRCMAVLP
jgi:hypothetical protein